MKGKIIMTNYDRYPVKTQWCADCITTPKPNCNTCKELRPCATGNCDKKPTPKSIFCTGCDTKPTTHAKPASKCSTCPKVTSDKCNSCDSCSQSCCKCESNANICHFTVEKRNEAFQLPNSFVYVREEKTTYHIDSKGHSVAVSREPQFSPNYTPTTGEYFGVTVYDFNNNIAYIYNAQGDYKSFPLT